MTTHTKGPLWVSSSTIVCTPNAQIVANCTPTGVGSLDLPMAECAANAALFATAPELLQTLRELAEVARDSVELSDWPELQELLERSGELIAKATGAQP